MQAFGVLDRYIGKTIFNTIMMTLFMLVSLSGIIKFVDQRAAQLCEIPQVQRSGSGTLPAQYVEQNLPAVVGGGDDADGAVVYLWPAA